MPWSRNKSGGFSTPRGGNVSDPKRYEALRRRGMSKKQAAMITNSKKGK